MGIFFLSTHPVILDDTPDRLDDFTAKDTKHHDSIYLSRGAAVAPEDNAKKEKTDESCYLDRKCGW